MRQQRIHYSRRHSIARRPFLFTFSIRHQSPTNAQQFPLAQMSPLPSKQSLHHLLSTVEWMSFFFLIKTNQWHCRLLDFENQRKSVQRLVHRLLAIPNRCLLYDLYNYISEMNSTLSLCSQYLRWIGKFRDQKEFVDILYLNRLKRIRTRWTRIICGPDSIRGRVEAIFKASFWLVHSTLFVSIEPIDRFLVEHDSVLVESEDVRWIVSFESN